MRTSLNNIKAIENYLSDYLAPGNALLFEAHMLVNSNLADDVQQQRNTYAVIRQYGRKKLKEEIAAVQQKLTAETQHFGFTQRIAQLFKK